MDKKASMEKFVEMIRQLVSDVQGAPYPGSGFEPELYSIWYEHVQINAQNCFEFLDENFPTDKDELSKTLQKMFKSFGNLRFSAYLCSHIIQFIL